MGEGGNPGGPESQLGYLSFPHLDGSSVVSYARQPRWARLLLPAAPRALPGWQPPHSSQGNLLSVAARKQTSLFLLEPNSRN